MPSRVVYFTRAAQRAGPVRALVRLMQHVVGGVHARKTNTNTKAETAFAVTGTANERPSH